MELVVAAGGRLTRAGDQAQQVGVVAADERQSLALVVADGLAAFAGGAEGVEDLGSCFIFFEGGEEVFGCLNWCLRSFDNLMPGCDGAGVLAAVYEAFGLSNEAEHLFVGGKIFEGGDASERAHPTILNDLGFA
jgi:hypothetical protein